MKYPEVEVQLTGTDGNAFSIMGKVNRALRRAGVSKEEQELYLEEATAGNYDHLLATTMMWVTIK